MTGTRAFGHGVVATPHYLASGAALEVLAGGGNAVDAVVAANLVLGVVTPYLCGVGGDLFAIVWDGAAHGYRSAGRAPAAATIERVAADAGDGMPIFGPHSVTVPGAVRGWFSLLARFGSRSFEELAAPAARLAEEGFPLTERGAAVLEGCRALYAGFDDLLAAYPEPRADTLLRQPALARTLRRLGTDGPDAFYGGPIGAAVAAAVQEQGGVMTEADVAAHEDAWVAPLAAGYRGAEILELPPPTQGVAALEALRILDGLDLAADGPERHHLMMEAVKLALADRDDHVGDPATMPLPAGALLAEEHVAARRAGVDPGRAARPASRPGADGGTAYLCAADGDGLLVSLIQSNFTAMGSGLHVRDWGLNLQNRGASFRLVPGHPNALGPGRLPLHTLAPALGLRDGRPWLVFGTMGGHSQTQTHVQVLTRLLVDGADPQAALDAPRWSVDPDRWWVLAERSFPDAWLERWRVLGHEVHRGRALDERTGHAHAIELGAAGYRGATDPRAEGAVLGR